jgi:hypothetical protein
MSTTRRIVKIQPGDEVEVMFKGEVLYTHNELTVVRFNMPNGGYIRTTVPTKACDVMTEGGSNGST